MRYRRGEVLLVPFPHVEQLGEKKRPAVVISSDRYHASCPDVIFAQITSRGAARPRVGDQAIRDWRAAGLIGPSLVRARLASLHTSRVIRRLGQLSDHDMRAFDKGLKEALALS